ncbi:uncharacterized protein TNCT_241761 [Trichonephila clavata]|uniref:Reverse transcriptase/retrotransposon-derived protein RNase H-like domain-containing protein n=1 Tax=Trichonephila clavata TaxID=2740835 RepID=A0A8X6IQQ1_TRICU|nr:uncharacterized protein TNCT_241761 [Trichonephila clavata]
MLNFYRRFLPNAAKHQTKLNDFLVGIKKNKNKSIDWDEDSIKDFEYCKEQLSESTTLAHPVSNAHLAIMVDASDKAVGGVMQQDNVDDSNAEDITHNSSSVGFNFISADSSDDDSSLESEEKDS